MPKRLSIPFTWDFSMHHVGSVQVYIHRRGFQFPLLGIFPCTTLRNQDKTRACSDLSIPFTWDFSMHPLATRLCGAISGSLSIPFTWDFSMHHIISVLSSTASSLAFNSLYLGFFHAPSTSYVPRKPKRG